MTEPYEFMVECVAKEKTDEDEVVVVFDVKGTHVDFDMKLERSKEYEVGEKYRMSLV
jgi:hypothetical protein